MKKKDYIRKELFITIFVMTILLLTQSSCSKNQILKKDETSVVKPKSEIPLSSKKEQKARNGHNIEKTYIPIPPPETPELKAVSEDLTPLNERIISISVKNASLSDVLHSIAETVNLNLIMEKGVNPDTKVTAMLRDIRAKDALDIVLSSTDYFYTIEGNILYVTAYKTETFEFGIPSIIQDYAIDIGGDILGASSDATSGKLKGNITLGVRSDEKGFKLWDAIEKGIEKILTTSKNDDQTTFSINRLAGTITVRATKKNLQEVRNYLETIKAILNRQVMIEARVVEVKLSNSLKYGIDWSFLDDWKGVGDITFGTENYTSTIKSGTPYFQFGITGVNFNSLLEALQSQGDVRVLSNPRVSLLNGQTALLSVGRSVELISRVETNTTTGTSTTSSTTFTVETSNILSGIIIGMVPYIDSEGNISITITPIVSDLVNIEESKVGQVGSNQITISLPTIDLREMSTTVKVKDGEMVIIGGLISTKNFKSNSEVPFISKIPVLGWLFKSKEETEERLELVIMLKPTLIRS